MTAIDENGMFQLLNGVVRRAQMDARRGKPALADEAKAFLADLKGMYQTSLVEGNNVKQSKRPAQAGK